MKSRRKAGRSGTRQGRSSRPRGELSFDIPELNLDLDMGISFPELELDINMPELDLTGFELPESFPEFEFDPDIFGGGGDHEQHDTADQG